MECRPSGAQGVIETEPDNDPIDELTGSITEVAKQNTPPGDIVDDADENSSHDTSDGGLLKESLSDGVDNQGLGSGAQTPISTAPEDEAATDRQDDNDIGFAWGAPKHVFVLSSAGKPVFSLVGDEQRLSTLMGLIQGLLSLCTDCGDDLESISAYNRRFVFLRRGELILVAVSSWSDWSSGDTDVERDCRSDGAQESETFLRLQLEYLYASIIFLLTTKVQAALRRSPGYDLRELLGGADPSLAGIVELAGPSRGRGRMLGGGVETVWMDPDIRSRVQSALQTAQAISAPSALYAIWLCGEELIALAQPRTPSHRLHSQDLLLLVNFIATQPALRNAESWTPVCFPRFQDQGYLYAYVAFLSDPDTRHATPSEDRSDEAGPSVANPGKSNQSSRAGDSCLILVSAEASAEQFQAFRRSRVAVESRFRLALGASWGRYIGAAPRVEREGILEKFCLQMQALHFYYCLRGRPGGAPCVTQVLSSSFVGALAEDPIGQRRIWGLYTRAALRLRRGSSQEGRVFCRDEDDPRKGFQENGSKDPGHGRRDPSGAEATVVFEADPVHSLTYEIGATETVVSLFDHREDGSGGGRWSSSPAGGGGERDELHVCFPASTPAEAAYKAAVRLVNIVRRDREWLFVTGTGAAR